MKTSVTFAAVILAGSMFVGCGDKKDNAVDPSMPIPKTGSDAVKSATDTTKSATDTMKQDMSKAMDTAKQDASKVTDTAKEDAQKLKDKMDGVTPPKLPTAPQ